MTEPCDKPHPQTKGHSIPKDESKAIQNIKKWYKQSDKVSNIVCGQHKDMK